MRNLIYYASFTGNTEKVAQAIGGIFKKNGWQNDFIKVDKSFAPQNHNIDFLSYDFICMGSPVFWHVPYDPLLWGVRNISHKIEYAHMETGPKMALAFATYAGAHFGEREADAALTLLEFAYEHLGFKSAGRIAVPGKVVHRPMEGWYFDDMHLRPNAHDLERVKEEVQSIISGEEFMRTYGNTDG